MALLAGLPACVQTAPPKPSAEARTDFVTCPTVRPQICTRDYRPVCAQRDTGVRCVTTPCPSSEWVTLGNACSACSDAKVLGYRAGPCT